MGDDSVEDKSTMEDAPPEASKEEITENGGRPSLYNDKPFEMTNGRKLARSTICFKKPQAANADGDDGDGDDDYEEAEDVVDLPVKTTTKVPPSLDSAWEYFEHIILPRCYVDPDDKNWKSKRLERAEPGEVERSTRLYPVFKTSDEDMSDFGIGIGLYFNKLKFLVIICFLAGIINIPNILYYASDEYGPATNSGDIFSDWIMSTSAACRDVSWQPCPDCDVNYFNSTFPPTNDRLAMNENNEIFIKKNNCNVTKLNSMVQYGTMIFIVVALFFLISYQSDKMVKFDEEQETTEDYAIEIKNPPNDARDPEEWKSFFKDTFDEIEVRAVTIALDNEELIKALVLRRKLILKLRNKLPLREDFDHDDLPKLVKECAPVPGWKKMFFLDAEASTIYDKIQKTDDDINKFSKKEYDVSSVFVIFETETGKNDVLGKLSLPRLKRAMLDKKFKFKGKVALDAIDAEEPSSIRWEDLNVSFTRRSIKVACTTIISFLLIFGAAAIIAGLRGVDAAMSSLAITIFNQITPRVVRLLTSYESHPNESAASGSNYIKMTVFRWVNTAIIYYIITPFTDTIQNGAYLIESVYTMLLFDVLLTPTLGPLDIAGNFMRHYFGPRAQSQRLMNLNFKAAKYDIGELETNITRVLFFALFYSTIFPLGYFMAGIVFLFAYIVDRFCILRSWQQSARVNSTVSKYTNNFLLLTVLAFTIMSSYRFATFPFDSACTTDDDVAAYAGDHTLTILGTGKETGITITGDDAVYKICNQNLLWTGKFPPTRRFAQSEENMWMNEWQENYSFIYGWTMVAIIIVIAVKFLYHWISKAVKVLFLSGWVPIGKPAEARFSDLRQIAGYVPQVFVDGFEFPFLLCDVDEIGDDMLSWDDPYQSYDYWNLIYDIPEIAAKKRQARELTTNNSYVGNEGEGVEVVSEDIKYNKLFATIKDWKHTSMKFGKAKSGYFN